MRDINVKVFNAQALTTDTGSTVVQVGKLGGALILSAQAPNTTGNLAGSIKIQFSNDPPDGTNTFAPSNWNDLANSSANNTSSTTYSFQSLLFNAEFVRAFFTYTSGAGTATVRLKITGVTH